MVVQALGGVMSITGPDGGEPTRVGTSVGDITAGLFGVIGILAAPHERAATGQGALVDVAMLDCQVAILENAIARYVTTGVVPGPIGARHPSITPFGSFRAADGHVILAAGNNALFARLCAVLGVPELAADERFASNHARCDHEPALRAALEAALASGTVGEWLARMEAHDLPAAPINDVAAVLAHPQVRARNMAVPVDDPAMPGFIVAGNPVKLSTQVDPAVRPAAPELGADRAHLLAELGLAPDVEGATHT
jgi:CoA:oxalate CoA-transferase